MQIYVPLTALFAAVTSTPSRLSMTHSPPDIARRSAVPRMCSVADDSSDFALLSRRIDELKAVHFMEGIILSEPLLPRQVLRMEAMPEVFADLVRECHSRNDTLGIIGADDNGEPLSCGVEVAITELIRETNDSGYGDPYVYSAAFIGHRIFELVHEEALTQFTFARDVRFVDLGLSDLMMAAKSRSRVVDLASRELTLLIRQWEELARGGGVTLWGKPRRDTAAVTAASEDQQLADADAAAAVDAAVTALLDSLGELPDLEFPSERALWAAALITAGRAGGQPAMAAVRPAILTAKTPLERLAVAKTGLVDAIYRMKGGNWPLDTFYWH